MAKSIIQTEKKCYLCGREFALERHHIMSGTANRKLSEQLGLWVWLCHDCHTGTDGAQYDKDKNQMLRMVAQMAYEKSHTHDEWMRIFRRNYLF